MAFSSESNHAAVFSTPHQRQHLKIEGIGDFNGDGYADAVISMSSSLTEGSFSFYQYFIITRHEANGPFKLLKEFDFNNIGTDISALESRYADPNDSVRQDQRFISGVLLERPLNRSRVTHYNNIAYYMEQAGNYDSAIYLLTGIIEKFPDRTVAYINLGDAYWGLKKHAEAQEAYRNYVRLMRETGREQRIPQRVFERMQ